MIRFSLIVVLLSTANAFAQQLPVPDVSKIAPFYQLQRNFEADGRAQCYAIVTELQARVQELEKQIAALKAGHEQK